MNPRDLHELRMSLGVWRGQSCWSSPHPLENSVEYTVVPVSENYPRVKREPLEKSSQKKPNNSHKARSNSHYQM